MKSNHDSFLGPTSSASRKEEGHSGRSGILRHDKALFQQFEESSDNSGFAPSEYWKQYTELIRAEINREGLSGFGRNANLTRGFGDARTYPARKRIRDILKLRFLYRPVEIILGHITQNRSQTTLYAGVKQWLTEIDFIDDLATEIDPVQKSLRINRVININNRRVPFRYLQAILYVELLKKVLGRDLPTASIDDILSGNTLDIGGGYGVVSDCINIFKRSHKIGVGTTDYIIDQFPVAYIAQQYLANRYPNVIRNPVLSDADVEVPTHIEANSVRVIQSSSIHGLNGLDIKYFFNSNSFQEMEPSQVSRYIEFIKNNQSKNSYVGCFFYHGKRVDNKMEPVLALLSEVFTLVGSTELRDVPNGVVSGVYFLFSVR